ncbi:MAG: hypothetical protein GY694_06895 [Gammaproteobacteria bacterium]|nr:hypothetical protein [Gammaproteobacteria bacterium]
MLKIRIAGTEAELRQVAHKAGSTRIKRFKRDNGKTTFAIDVEITVKEFLGNLDLSHNSDANSSESNANEAHNDKMSCNPKEIQAELEELLDDISDKD